MYLNITKNFHLNNSFMNLSVDSNVSKYKMQESSMQNLHLAFNTLPVNLLKNVP